LALPKSALTLRRQHPTSYSVTWERSPILRGGRGSHHLTPIRDVGGQEESCGADVLQAGSPMRLLPELEHPCDFANPDAIFTRSDVHTMPAEPCERTGAALEGDRSRVHVRSVFVDQSVHVLLGEESVAVVADIDDLELSLSAPPKVSRVFTNVPDGHRAPVAVKLTSRVLKLTFSLIVNGSGGAACAAGVPKASSAPAVTKVTASFLIMDAPEPRPIQVPDVASVIDHEAITRQPRPARRAKFFVGSRPRYPTLADNRRRSLRRSTRE
jgi:hypothetical protein